MAGEVSANKKILDRIYAQTRAFYAEKDQQGNSHKNKERWLCVILTLSQARELINAVRKDDEIQKLNRLISGQDAETFMLGVFLKLDKLEKVERVLE